MFIGLPYIAIFKVYFAFKMCTLLALQIVFCSDVLVCFHQRTPLDWAASHGHDVVVAYLKRAADPNMLEVCETVPLRIVVVSSGEAPTLTNML